MIDVRGLTYAYAGQAVPAVESIDFQVERGEIFGFLGPSGAGKSTTQKVLIRLLRDYAGHVSILGRDLRSWGSDYYERVGISFELPYHYLKLTALENLTYFRALYSGPTEDPQHLLDLVGLGEEGGKRVQEFSKGMRMRLSFARALLHRPEVLFLDEPTSGLDPGTSRGVRDLIRQRREDGVTVFLTTHNMTLADELCDRVAFLVNGRIALVDSPRALKLRHGRRTVRVEWKEARPSGAALTPALSQREREKSRFVGSREERNDEPLRSKEFPLDGLAENVEFLEILRRADVQTIHTQETTLEDVFLQVTGRPLT